MSKPPTSKSDGGSSQGKPDAAKPSPDASSGEALSTTIETKAGPIAGEAVTHEDKQILVFRGVPYAAPPVGELRWKPPQPLEPWTDVRDATQWGNRSPQADSTLTSLGAIGEDCLNLNVLTPAKRASERLPVMVFFHGGGLSIGTGNSPTYCHTALPAKGVVVITVNSRLGAFGYFSHPALAAESDHDSSGNYGTLDLIASLQWVQDNIAAFGGDRDNVTIFGESGGGSKVLSCMASPLAKGLFHRAVIESGSRSAMPNAVTARQTAEEGGQRLAANFGIPEDANVLSALRAKTWQEILAGATAAMVTSNLSIDGWVLPQSVNDVFAAGKQSDVPLIVGANEGEPGEFAQSIPSLAASMQSVSSKAYVYNFTQLPLGWRAEGCYAFHGLELPYVFGHMDGIKSATILFLGMRSCSTGSDPQIGAEDEMIAENTMRIWTQFAKTGNPSVAGLVDWPAYTQASDQYLEIGPALTVKSGVAASGQTPATAPPATPAP
ncbi:MAG TPA: carboxylesterase family protein [Polyangiales bacterium]|nr:carboxylesterase family protein [Polyangiales bacterium]